MRARPLSTIRRVVDVGTKGKEAAGARRIRTVNAVALFGIVANCGFDAFYLTSGDPTLTPLILINAGFIAFYGLMFPLNSVSRTRFPWTQNWLNRSVQGGPEHDR